MNSTPNNTTGDNGVSRRSFIKGTVATEGQNLVVNGEILKCFSERDPALIPWGEVGVDVVIE